MLTPLDFDFVISGEEHTLDCGDPLSVELSNVHTTDQNPSATASIIILVGMLVLLTAISSRKATESK